MKDYIAELGHIIGNVGEILHHTANLLTLTAQNLTKDQDEDNPAAVGAIAQTERTEQAEPNEMRTGDSADLTGYARTRIGFRSAK